MGVVRIVQSETLYFILILDPLKPEIVEVRPTDNGESGLLHTVQNNVLFT